MGRLGRRTVATIGVMGALFAAAGEGVAGEGRCFDGAGETVWAGRAVGGDEIETLDGERIRLSGVAVPRPAPGGAARGGAAGAEAADVAEAARVALEERVEGREATFHAIGKDRHGRRVGHLVDTESGQWLEEALVAAGWLRVVPEAGDRVCAKALIAVERTARVARRGAWATATFAVRRADDDLTALDGAHAVVEGRVVSIGRSGRRIWLNFGDDIRRDFAVVLDDNDAETFRRAGVAVERLKGRTVTVRGVVTVRGAPQIAVGLPEEIETTKE